MLILAGKLLLWISFTFIYIVQNITHAQPDFSYYACVVESGNFTMNSIYEVNLNYTLKAISDQGFDSISHGDGQDKANSVALCRGDVDPGLCRSCLNDSVVKLRQICPNQKEAVGYYDSCLLKYSNETILGNTLRRFFVFVVNPQNASDQDGFNRALRQLMNRLRSDAAAGGPQLKFATGSTTVPDFETIYGLVQCTPDLNQTQCSSCLEDAINQFEYTYSGKVGGRTLLPMCNFRYETYPFFNGSTLVIPPPPPLQAPPGNGSSLVIPPPPPGTVIPH